MAPSSRLISAKLVLLYSFYCCLSGPDQYRPAPSTSGTISSFAHALLYHKYQPAPLLSRANRQPHSQPQQHQQNFTSDSYYQNSQAATLNNYNRQQQQQQKQQQQQQQQQQQISYLRDSSDEDDSYGCPSECHCNEIAHIADCSNRSLTRVPSTFPKDIKRIRLEINNITEIGPYAFQGLKRLQRIDLSQNKLYKIDPLAFSGGLQNLNSLILYSNKLEYLPVNVFNELSRLQLLLLNANLLQNIQKDLFQALTNLHLLSLHDNKIVTLTSGTFDGLKSIKTIHLGKNPLNCDCNLRWLVDYVEANPGLETSEARCESPQRARDKKLSEVNKRDFKCQEQPVKTNPSPAAHAEPQPGSCPAGCVCNGNTVDCSPLGQSTSTSESRTGAANSGGLYELPDVPDDLPIYVARVHINDNRIKRIRQTGLFRKLANSQKLDLGNNKIVDVEDNAINGRLPNGQKPERVIFVLLENQHCNAAQQQKATSWSSASGEDEQEQAGIGNVGQPPAPLHQFKSSSSVSQGDSRQLQQQQQNVVYEQQDPCTAAPKVNEPQFDSPCYNGGTCKALSVSSSATSGLGSNFTCHCQAGFGGPLCEINLDDCVDHQCQNGAMCVDGINSYKCICRDPTTSGEFCEQFNNNNGNNKANNNNNIIFNPPYATSSANSIAPLALPIIAQSSPAAAAAAAMQAANELNAQREGTSQVQQSQILARSADFLRAPDDLATNSLQQQQQALPLPVSSSKAEAATIGAASSTCHRVTTSKYYDDGNGCQSVRLLKMSECSGGCDRETASGHSATGSCCAPTKIKRRRIHMQCNDGASYVKVIDLVKKCSCSPQETVDDGAGGAVSCPANNLESFGRSTSVGASSSTTSTSAPPLAIASLPTRSPSTTSQNAAYQFFKYSTGGGGSGGAYQGGEYQKKRKQQQVAPSRQQSQRQSSPVLASSYNTTNLEQDSLLHLDAIE